ncbi:MAG TPA: trehalase family glycosidase [Ktedonobacteraceae bacterium]|nr:trehalase family glycosidase [Ktedonobacteraceae bacterium]
MTLHAQWQTLDSLIASRWEDDLHTALEDDLRKDSSGTLLFLPHPYSSTTGYTPSSPEMSAWDTHFINLALLEHGRYDLVLNHVLNYLFQIERHGFMPTGNRASSSTRSQTPVFPNSIWSYYQATGQRAILHRAYPLLLREYTGYWAQTSLDFTTLFDGDLRQGTPLITNCALVQYARVLSWIAQELGERTEALRWQMEAKERAQRIQDLCWNEEAGFFFEYDYEKQQQLPFWSLSAYWTLWAAIATEEQSQRLAEHLIRFEQPHGLSLTDQQYTSPLSQFAWIQWGYPVGWAPLHIITVSGLDAYGHHEEARRVSEKFVSLLLKIFQETENLYEKYNVLDGNAQLPAEHRSEAPARTSTAAVILGRRVFTDRLAH